MRNGIIVCRFISLIKTYLLAFHVLRKFRDSAPLKGTMSNHPRHFYMGFPAAGKLPELC